MWCSCSRRLQQKFNLLILLVMKRKMRLFLLATFVVAGVASLSAAVYETTCGKMLMSVGREAFLDDKEYESYLKDLNEIECGNGSGSAERIR